MGEAKGALVEQAEHRHVPAKARRCQVVLEESLLCTESDFSQEAAIEVVKRGKDRGSSVVGVQLSCFPPLQASEL